MNQIILLSGHQGSGKSTVQQLLVDAFRPAKFVWTHAFNFADAIYHFHNLIYSALETDFGMPFPKPVKDGVLLQVLGTEWGRKVLGNDIWVKIMRSRIDQATKEPGNHVFIVGDTRFRNEFDAFPEALRVRLNAPECIRKYRAHSWRENTAHPSEIDLDQYDVDGRFDLYFESYESMTSEKIATNIVEVLSRGHWLEGRKV